jgi:hypothetical protein
VAVLCVAVVALLPERIWGQKIGLFFDANATLCAGEIEPFGPAVHLWMFMFPPPDSLLGGAIVRLQLPPGLEIPADDQFFPNRTLIFRVGGDLTGGGLDLRFSYCFTGSEPQLLGQFGLVDLSSETRHDIPLHLSGGSPDSMAVYDKPQFLICDPEDPQNFIRLLEAPPVDATLNCTTSRCYCTTAVQPAPWSAIKRLYQGR